MPATAENLIRVCLEFDQQMISHRPSWWGEAAELLATLCEHAEPSLRRPGLMGDWRSVDLTSVHRRAPRNLDQPTINAIYRREQLAKAAPDLLSALIRLMDERCPFEADTETCECGSDGEGEVGSCEHVQARRAIAKATT